MAKQKGSKKKLLFYTYPSCTSCRKTKAWLNEKGIDFEEHHLFKEPLTVEELKNLVRMTQNGVDDILATRSQKFKQMKVDYRDLKLSEMLEMIHNDPRLLRRPILTDGENLIIGYDKDGLESLLA